MVLGWLPDGHPGPHLFDALTEAYSLVDGGRNYIAAANHLNDAKARTASGGQ